MKSPNNFIYDALNKTERTMRLRGIHRQQNSSWASFYSAHLLAETEFSRGSEREWQADELTQALIDLDTAYQRKMPKQSWSQYLADRLFT